ncbi:MAG: (Fe-S)-binding protein [Thiogranum sp.]
MNDLSATDRCVKCGLCLPHCPTFILTGNEADSPRGRISLMQAIDQPDAQYTAGFFRHLDQCLHCGACEAMCPSRVPFGRLMDTARAAIEPHRKRSPANRVLRRMALHCIASPAWTKALAIAIRTYQRLGLQWLVAKAPCLPVIVKHLNRLLPTVLESDNPSARKHVTEQRGVVNLFRGCAGSLFDQQSLNAAQRLLESLGYRVNVPPQQGCCGALHQHNGDPDTAARLADGNWRAFSANSGPVLVTASGCTAHLSGYNNLYENEPANAFAERVNDIAHFLCRQNRANVQFRPLEETVAVYIPCTHRNALRQQQDILDILSWIPGIEPLVINPQGGCCGAAGSYMLSQPELSGRLREPLMDTLVQCGARLLLTTNIGCAIQLQAGLKERRVAIDILHPVVLLDRLLAGPDKNGIT